jgi:hypothetical protein
MYKFQAVYYQRHKELIKQKQKEYYNLNRDKILQDRKETYRTKKLI